MSHPPEHESLRHALSVAVEHLAAVGYPLQNWGQFMGLVAEHFSQAEIGRWTVRRQSGGILQERVASEVAAERERCVMAIQAVAADAVREGMEKVDDLLSNIADALRRGLSPEETLAFLLQRKQ